MAAKYLSPSLLWMWHAKGATFVDPSEQGEALLESPLADLCRRQDGPRLFKYLSRGLEDEAKEGCLKYLLLAAVLDGTAEMVKVCCRSFEGRFSRGRNFGRRRQVSMYK